MKHIRAELITIGDEILYGQIVDTNAQWMSRELDKIGVRTVRRTTVGDLEQDILSAFKDASQRADIILVTGGLGPTNDDLTKPCLAKFYQCELALNENALREIQAIFQKIGRELSEPNRLQAYLPARSTMVSNRVGTAPGMWFEDDGQVLVSMPGVPHEMKTMMKEQVLPKLQSVFKTPVIFHKLVKTIGIGESWLAELLQPWEQALPDHIKLAYLPGLGEVKLRLTAVGANLSQLEAEVNKQIENLHSLAGKYVYGYDQDTLPKVVGEHLRANNLTIACAESCSGGSIAKALTSIPGSSGYFRGAVVAYHNDLKESLLNVSQETLKEFGAVSEETVLGMAQGVRIRLNADIGVASSGIAGPGGGSLEKPVGTVWIAYADNHYSVAKKLSLFKDRSINIKFTTQAVLNLVRQSLPQMDGEKV